MKHFPALPHDEIRSVWDGIWFVEGAVKMSMLIPMQFTRAMTIVRNADGESLTVVNSMRLTEEGHAALDALGPVTHVLRLAGGHGRDDGFYRDRYGAEIWALRGQVYSRKLPKPGLVDNFLEPDRWLDAGDALPFADATLHVIEGADPSEGLVHLAREGGIVISGDVLQNMAAPNRFTNFPAKLMMKKMGFFAPYNIGPGWVDMVKPSAASMRALLDLEFEHVLPAHGDIVRDGAREKFRPAIERVAAAAGH